MFLKPYTGLSDDGLIEMLNSNIHMQMFCGVLIDPSQPIKDGKIVSAIRNRLVPRLDIVRQPGESKINYFQGSIELFRRGVIACDFPSVTNQSPKAIRLTRVNFSKIK